jgi:hypothetical protein
MFPVFSYEFSVPSLEFRDLVEFGPKCPNLYRIFKYLATYSNLHFK